MARNLHFDLLAPFYDRAIPPPSPQDYVDILRLPISGDLLDVGGGTGRASAFLQSCVGRLVLCDLSFRMLQQARLKDAHTCLRCRVQQLPFPPATFERVLVVDALHHFGDQQRALASLLDVLKPGGRLVIEEPHGGTLPGKIIGWLEKLALMGSHIHKPDQIQNMIADLGYLSTIQPYGQYAVWITVDK